MPMPDARELTRLTWQVAANDNFTASRRQGRRDARIAFLRRRVKHVIDVVKENRSCDQLFGDLDRGNGDPRLVLFGASLTPNHHRLARQFVTLDAFFDSGETRNNGGCGRRRRARPTSWKRGRRSTTPDAGCNTIAKA
jgi:phospholipase C